MEDRKYDYNKIYDELYDDEPDDILSIEINKDLIERQHAATVEEKLISNDKVTISQVNSMPSQKPLLDIHEKNDIMTEMENAHSRNKETSVDCVQANGNIDDLKKMDLHFDASIQTNNSTRMKNECNVDTLTDNNYFDTNVTTKDISQLKKEEKEAMERENGEDTQKNGKELNTIKKTSVKEERYNIYEHGTFNSKTEVLKKEGMNDIHNNKGGEASQDDRTIKNDTSETINSTECAEDKKDKNESRNTFECNICFDDVRDPVVTKCGHLFCWSCLSSWIKKNNDCPVCKAEVLKETVIPLYGRGTRSNDHAYKNATYEPRPKPNRKEPSVRTRPGNNNVGLRTLGVWVNPFSFALSYTNMSEEPYFGDNTTENRRIQTETYQAEIASSLFFFLGCFISLYLFFFPS